MLSNSLVNTPVPSIALIASMAAAQVMTTPAFAEQLEPNTSLSRSPQTITLPDMGNTTELDRSLSREVSDTFVFDQASQDQTISNQKAASNVIPGTPSQATDTSAIKATIPADTPGPGIPDVTAGSGRAVDSSRRLAESGVSKPVLERVSALSDTVWQHIIRSDLLPVTDHERVKFYINQYQRESKWISKIFNRGTPFLAHMVTTLDQRFMPLELALLPAIESGYKPTAKSTGNARGLWQIVPITATEIGLAKNDWFDGRGDVLASTTAAIDYLSYLNAEFDGDWELTLAAYNAGPGRITEAIIQNEKNGLPTDYWSLDLPLETQNYVPKITAMIAVLKMPDHGGIDLPPIAMEPAFESIDIGFRISLERAAQIADIDLGLLRSLNAGLTHGVTAPQGPHHLLIPTGSGEKFQKAFQSVDRSAAFSEPNTHNVASGDTISSIALRYGLTQHDLLSMNGLNDTKIWVGQKLLVNDNKHLAKSIVKYVVLIGDTLSEIARQFSVNVGDITLSTGEALSDDVIHPGDTLNITVNTPTSG